MLRVGLTGGIGAGKSTVARRFAELGATVLDADQVAREVVRPGSVGLSRVVEQFGTGVLDPAGALDRAALADIVFGDAEARQRLNGIVHPLVGSRTAELKAAAPVDGIVVQDIPLLVEDGMAPAFPLVVVVDAPEEERIRRLVADRGMTGETARARIAAQATVASRKAAADVWLDNSGSPDAVLAELDRLWRDRLLPFEAVLRTGTPPAPSGPPRLAAPDQEWPDQFDRLAARIARAAGELAVRIDHIGSTSVADLPAKDVIDIQLAIGSLEDVEDVAAALREAGFLDRPVRQDRVKPFEPDPARWRKRLFTSADPGRPVNLHVREIGSAGYRYALLFRDWLRADPTARAEYVALKRGLAAAHADDLTAAGYAAAKEPWFDNTLDRANLWAEHTGWRTPTGPTGIRL